MSRIWLAFFSIWISIAACGGDDGTPDGSTEADAGGGDAAARCTSATECDDGTFCNGAERCDPADPSADALGCVAGSDPCNEDERCDEGADECLVGCTIDDDVDGDGVVALACGGEDCDDTDSDVNPSAPEICDVGDVDEDCDPSTFGTRDADEDGAIDAACCNGDRCGTDCDDTRGSVRPGATEACNGRDDDCDGPVDEGLTVAIYGRDCDRDGFASSEGTVAGCSVPPGFPDCGVLDGAWTTTLGDCDDTLASRNPGNADVCNGVDDDCDPAIDEDETFASWGPDCDGDGFASSDGVMSACAAPTPAPSCGGTPGAWRTSLGDCDDTRGSVNPGNPELCNDRDDDCDTAMDEGLTVRAYGPDCDGDGFAATGATTTMDCGPPSAAPTCGALVGTWSTVPGDCDDARAARNPGAAELCNATDDDCNVLVDDITSGTVVCAAGSVGACTNACGVAGTRACAMDCLGFGACSSTSSELCNYCDDDGDGLADDRALATRDTNETTSCGVADFATYGSASCETLFVGGGGAFDLEAVLLPGTSTSEAGALWMTPSSWTVGYGTVEVEVELQARVRPAGGDAEVPVGSWAIVIAHSGTPGVGSGAGSGIPSGVDGIAARWFWSQLDSCYGNPPFDGDGLRADRVGPGGARIRRVEDGGDFGCFSSAGLSGGQTGLGSGTTTTQRQRMRVRYTPNDPSTPANEETLVIFAQSPAGSGDSTTFTYRATDSVMPRLSGELAPGQRLMVGITAGTHTTSSMGFTFGVPIEAKARVWRFTPPSGPGAPTYSDFDVHVRRNDLCP
jgi:hypothetical protein